MRQPVEERTTGERPARERSAGERSAGKRTDARGQGLGRRLPATAEEAAAAAGVTLLHLDTETDSPAEHLYRTGGWTRAGVIPDCAADPSGVLRPTTLYHKHLAPA